MKKTRTEIGITLIALIITIVVLLIIAVVAINAITESNIIGYAQNAAEEYNNAKNDEESTLSEYEEIIESNLPGGQQVGEDDSETTRIPFANYIEDGPYYYVCEQESVVITISRETSSFTYYVIRNGKAESESIYNFEIISKLEAINSFGFGPEDTEQLIGHSFDSLSDDALYYNVEGENYAANVFTSNYTEMIFSNNWYTLDMDFEFPE